MTSIEPPPSATEDAMQTESTSLPPLEIPISSLSAPASTMPTRSSSPLAARAQSARPSPTKQPIVLVSKSGRRVSVPPAVPRSPSRFMRKHAHHATFGSEARNNKVRAILSNDGKALMPDQEDGCSVHAYSELDEATKRPATAVFGTAPRDVLALARIECPVHAYAEVESTLTRRGAACFGVERRKATSNAACPEAYYATPPSTLSRKGASAFNRHHSPRDFASVDGRAPVHSYTPLGLASVSSFKKNGGVAFGSTASRSLGPLGMTRHGLFTATATPKQPRRLSPLVPTEAAVKEEGDEEGIDGRPASPTSVLV